MDKLRARRLSTMAGIAVLAGTLTGSAALATSGGLQILPNGNGASASYVFDFDAEYSGYREHYRGLLDLKQISRDAVIVSGRNDRLTGDELLHLGLKSQSRTSDPFTAHVGPDGLVVSDEETGVADQVFDYNELLSLLRGAGSPPSASTWWANTPCWISNTLTAPVPVRVVVSSGGDAQTLTAHGERRLQAGTPGSPLTADIQISWRASFRDGTLTNAALHAREIYERNGAPAGGGVYHWTVSLKEGTR